jgi:hypothetical protein
VGALAAARAGVASAVASGRRQASPANPSVAADAAVSAAEAAATAAAAAVEEEEEEEEEGEGEGEGEGEVEWEGVAEEVEYDDDYSELGGAGEPAAEAARQRERCVEPGGTARSVDPGPSQLAANGTEPRHSRRGCSSGCSI